MNTEAWLLGCKIADVEVGEETSGCVGVGSTGTHRPGFVEFSGIQAATLKDGVSANMVTRGNKGSNIVDFT